MNTLESKRKVQRTSFGRARRMRWPLSPTGAMPAGAATAASAAVAWLRWVAALDSALILASGSAGFAKSVPACHCPRVEAMEQHGAWRAR